MPPWTKDSLRGMILHGLDAISDVKTYPSRITATLSGTKRGIDNFSLGGTMTGLFIPASGTYGNKNVSTVVIAATAGSNHASRSMLLVTPIDGDLYWGFDNSVTIANGTLITATETAKFLFNPLVDVDIYIIAESGTVDTRFVEA